MTSCIICKSETYEIDDKQFQIIYHRCMKCGFIFQGSKYHVSFEQERKIYEYHNNSIDDQGYVGMFNKFIDSFESFVSGKDLLEFGSGPEPVFSEIMRRKGYLVTMFDLHYHNDESYLNKTYDVITSTEVFEHFKNPIEEMEKLVPLLRSGGVLAIMTNFPKDDNHFLDWWYRRDETHISFYTLESFEYIGKKYGLDIVHTNNKNYMIFMKR